MRAVYVLNAALVASSVLILAAWQQPRPVPFGFTSRSSAAHLAAEKRFLAIPSAERIRQFHRFLAGEPHLAGSKRDRELAEWTRDKFSAAGLEDVQIVTHDVLLPWPQEVLVEMGAWRASMREDPIPGDPFTQIAPEAAGIPYHAYSASGDVTAPVVYAGSGNPPDYDALARRGIDIRGKIALVRYSVPYSYRGFKALTAEQRGAAGILIYSDPEDDGAAKGKVYPDGPWGPESHIQRGAIVYDFMIPGDPLTPGWASVPGARRIPAAEAASVPKIVSAPLSFKDARVILDALGIAAKRDITLPQADGVLVHMRVRCDSGIRPIWTVTGMIRGSDQPDDLVIAGNHRDAWIDGGVDPSSGSAALVELATSLGKLARGGWRPKRSILFASWDAEEFTLTSSTEWGEQNEAQLRDHAIAYINVDSAASGRAFTSSAVPALNRVIEEAASAVKDPALRIPVSAAWRERHAQERGVLPGGQSDSLVNNRLGSGSDYTVFLNFIGIPVADLSFEGPYGVYHSIYDNHNWVARIGDPGFRYHTTLVRIWGLILMRLAGADVVPLDYEPYASRIADFAGEVAPAFPDVRGAANELLTAAAAFAARRNAALSSNDTDTFAGLNRALVLTERAFLSHDGIPGRPWYRHLVYAPKFTYAPDVLPGLADALAAGNGQEAERQARALAAALREAAAQLHARETRLDLK